MLAIAAITAASFYLNAVFGFAIVQSGAPKIRPAAAQARAHLRVILWSGAVVGLLLGLVMTVVTRWGRPWFAISLSVMLGGPLEEPANELRRDMYAGLRRAEAESVRPQPARSRSLGGLEVSCGCPCFVKRVGDLPAR